MKFGRNYKHCSGQWVCLLIEKKKAKNREKKLGVAGASAGFPPGGIGSCRLPLFNLPYLNMSGVPVNYQVHLAGLPVKIVDYLSFL